MATSAPRPLRILTLHAWDPYVRAFYRPLAGRRELALVEPFALSLAALWRHRRRVDVIHVHWLDTWYRGGGAFAAAGRAARFGGLLVAARVLGYRLLLTAHNLRPHEAGPRGVDLALHLVVAHLAHCVLVLGRASAALVRTRWGRARGVWRTSAYASCEGAPPPVPRAEARRALGLQDDERLLVAAGGVRHYKRLTLILRTFARLEGAHLRLVVAGRCADPARAAALGALAARDPRVRLDLEWQTPEALARLLSAADAAVFAHAELLGSASAPLAASYGPVLVAPDRPFYREVAPPGRAVFFRAHDAGALRVALAQALARADRSDRAAGPRWARRHGWARQAPAFTRRLRRATFRRTPRSPSCGV